ncbi:hypothetical protein H4F99_08030 [Lysobacter sp. SG-8]|uniref:Transmembrane protein n=1 Tax=Marilutibacter penaei TaxID=2759900 RepID=A0A7W3U3U6_9GAMM|nr:hypothetical protein [Lysobacter penaei]MBB1088437.1 hypothetical protein [Lysobacter penaei]
MPDRDIRQRPARPRPSAWALLVLSMAVLTVMWVLLSLYTEGTHGWMAIVAALDVAWVLRFGGWRPGPGRAVLATCAVALVVLASQWGLIAGHVGSQFGLSPWMSALKLGPAHAWWLAQAANGPLDWAGLLAGILLAALASR